MSDEHLNLETMTDDELAASFGVTRNKPGRGLLHKSVDLSERNFTWCNDDHPTILFQSMKCPACLAIDTFKEDEDTDADSIVHTYRAEMYTPWEGYFGGLKDDPDSAKQVDGLLRRMAPDVAEGYDPEVSLVEIIKAFWKKICSRKLVIPIKLRCIKCNRYSQDIFCDNKSCQEYANKFYDDLNKIWGRKHRGPGGSKNAHSKEKP